MPDPSPSRTAFALHADRLRRHPRRLLSWPALLLLALAAILLPSCGDDMTRTDTTASAPLPARIEAELAAEWPTTLQTAPEGLAWDRRTSPPIPDAWPVTKTTRITCYAYAAAQDPERLRDGEEVAVPWGTVDYQLDSPVALHFARIGARLRPLGTQGVRPMTRGEADAVVADAELHRSLATLAESGDARLAAETLAAYRAWRRLNGMVAAPILERHPAFAAALEGK